MDFKHVRSSQKKHPSKMVALFSLCVVISLPFVLVKTFRQNKPLNPVAKSIALPQHQNETHQLTTVLTKKSIEVKDATPSQKQNTSAKDDWLIFVTKKGDTLASLFKQAGLSPKTLSALLKDNPHAKKLTTIKPGQKIQLSLSQKKFNKLIVPLNPMQSLVVSKEQDKYKTVINSRKVSHHNRYVTATVEGSLHATAKKMGISHKLIYQLSKIFNWEIDFSKDVREGDRFTIVYKAYFIENKPVGTGEIIAATYTTRRGKSFRAIRHTNPDGQAGYYNESGQSLEKAFTRYPVKYSHISSTFSLSRMHPVLKKKRPHKGVDLAAPLGTPIRSVGDGRITSIGRNNGFGNMIKIQHNKTYSTVYAHMLKFRKGLSRGSRIKRGEIIGYVGQSGLATGPHCHFEFHINRHPKNPSTVKLPLSTPVGNKDLAVFKYNAGALLAHMKLFEDASLSPRHITNSAVT